MGPRQANDLVSIQEISFENIYVQHLFTGIKGNLGKAYFAAAVCYFLF